MEFRVTSIDPSLRGVLGEYTTIELEKSKKYTLDNIVCVEGDRYGEKQDKIWLKINDNGEIKWIDASNQISIKDLYIREESINNLVPVYESIDSLDVVDNINIPKDAKGLRKVLIIFKE